MCDVTCNLPNQTTTEHHVLGHDQLGRNSFIATSQRLEIKAVNQLEHWLTYQTFHYMRLDLIHCSFIGYFNRPWMCNILLQHERTKASVLVISTLFNVKILHSHAVIENNNLNMNDKSNDDSNSIFERKALSFCNTIA